MGFIVPTDLRGWTHYTTTRFKKDFAFPLSFNLVPHEAMDCGGAEGGTSGDSREAVWPRDGRLWRKFERESLLLEKE